VSGIVTYAALSVQGEQLRSMQNRLTWVLKTSGHVLRIVHEHTSAPVGFEDAKAILSRADRS
jgi:ketosteroid isomerase-like protein